MKFTRIALLSTLAVSTSILGAQVAQAQEALPSVDVSSSESALVLHVNDGSFAVDGGSVRILGADGQLVESLPSEFHNEDGSTTTLAYEVSGADTLAVTKVGSPTELSTRGWWKDWGKCAAGVIGGAGGGATAGGLGGAAVGAVTVPVVGSVPGGAVGAVGGGLFGGLSGAAAAC